MKQKKNRFFSFSRIIDYFFQTNNAFGLDISDFSIEALQLKRYFKGVRIESYGRIKLEKGTVDDGEIFSKKELQKKIEELLENLKFKGLKLPEVIFSLPESKIFLHIFELPANISAKELPRAIESEVLKTLPIDLSKLYFDFQVISKKVTIQEILYVAVEKRIVDDYLEVMDRVGLTPLALDIESASLARTFKGEVPLNGGMMILDIGARSTILTIFDQNAIRVSSIIKIAGNHFAKTISQKLNISFKEAEKLKRTHGLDEKRGEGRIMFILQNILNDILDKTKNLINFYQGKTNRKIKKVLLVGGSSLIPKLISYFATNLNIETKLGDLSTLYPGLKKKIQQKLFIRDIIDPKDITKEQYIEERLHSVFFSNVIGLALRGLEIDPERDGINLIPEAARFREPAFIGRKLHKSKIFNLLIVIVTIFNLLFFAWVIYNYIVKSFLSTLIS